MKIETKEKIRNIFERIKLKLRDFHISYSKVSESYMKNFKKVVAPSSQQAMENYSTNLNNNLGKVLGKNIRR